jgi:putative transposase
MGGQGFADRSRMGMGGARRERLRGVRLGRRAWRQAQRYRPSPRPYRGLPDIEYPFHDQAATVTTCGRIYFNRQKINLSQVFAGQTVGIKQTDERIWLVSFMDYDLGYFDDETCRLEPLANPFGPKLLPMSSV